MAYDVMSSQNAKNGKKSVKTYIYIYNLEELSLQQFLILF